MGGRGWASSSTAIAIDSPRGVAQPGDRLRALGGSRSLATALDPAGLHERLRKIRPLAPTLAQELEIARHQAARLRVQNRRVLEEVRRLQKQREQTGAGTDQHRS